MTEGERGRGVLTPKDREYLKDPKTYREENSRQMVHDRNTAVRERVLNGLLDFTVLLEDLDVTERREILGGKFGHLSEEERRDLLDPDSDDTEIVEAIQNATAFLYLTAADRPENQHELIEEGVRRGEQIRSSWQQLVDVSLEVQTSDVNSAASRAQAKMEREEELTDAEVRSLLKTGRVDPGTVAEYLRD